MKENISLLANIAAVLACFFSILFPQSILEPFTEKVYAENQMYNVNDTIVSQPKENDSLNVQFKNSKRAAQENFQNKINERYETRIRLVFSSLLVIFLFFIVASSASENLWLRIQTKRRDLNNSLIIEKRTTIIDWYDYKNNLATYYEEGHFKKIGKLKTYLGSLSVDGIIVPNSIKGIKCSNYPSNDNKRIDIYYINNNNSLNNIKSLFPRKIKEFFAIKALLKDTFKSSEDQWAIGAINYCKFLEFKIRFPKKIKIKNAQFTDKEGNYIVGLQPIIKRDVSGRDTIILKVSDFDRKQDFILKWEIV